MPGVICARSSGIGGLYRLSGCRLIDVIPCRHQGSEKVLPFPPRLLHRHEMDCLGFICISPKTEGKRGCVRGCPAKWPPSRHKPVIRSYRSSEEGETKAENTSHLCFLRIYICHCITFFVQVVGARTIINIVFFYVCANFCGSNNGSYVCEVHVYSAVSLLSSEVCEIHNVPQFCRLRGGS